MKKLASLAKPARLFSALALGVSLSFGNAFIEINPVQAQNASNRRIVAKVNQLKQSDRKWIQVDISQQRLIAWQGDRAVYGFTVSTGKRKTPTLTGIFNVQTKHRQTRMRGEGYDIKNVPYVMYYDGGYGIHGAFWHNNFGTRVSRGCVNLPPRHAKTLFNWAGVGTPVIVQH